MLCMCACARLAPAAIFIINVLTKAAETVSAAANAIIQQREAVKPKNILLAKRIHTNTGVGVCVRLQENTLLKSFRVCIFRFYSSF